VLCLAPGSGECGRGTVLPRPCELSEGAAGLGSAALLAVRQLAQLVGALLLVGRGVLCLGKASFKTELLEVLGQVPSKLLPLSWAW